MYEPPTAVVLQRQLLVNPIGSLFSPPHVPHPSRQHQIVDLWQTTNERGGGLPHIAHERDVALNELVLAFALPRRGERRHEVFSRLAVTAYDDDVCISLAMICEGFGHACTDAGCATDEDCHRAGG